VLEKKTVVLAKLFKSCPDCIGLVCNKSLAMGAIPDHIFVYKSWKNVIIRNETNKCIYRCVNLLHYNIVAYYMFQPPIVAIFRVVFFEGYIT
jgi:hypothetical protein